MDIHTQQSISWFIVSDPQLSYNDQNQARFYARFGQEDFDRNPDGTFTQLDSTFHDLVLFRASAERAHERFKKGDSFVAEGYVREYETTRDGEQIQAEQFVAKKIGHDTARTRYDVDRTPRTPAPVLGQNAPAVEAPARETPTLPGPEVQAPNRASAPTPPAPGL
ncbi:single-stranded DNA-binding protein [Micrococcus terreus]|uniref:single-stranded DNA-binding protein n=1 Tax=Micrococcus terreus TaxID=574650 RepID=UPI0023F9864D|nr:single-stranded DNA-binding protein [Micrococcus terreus]